MFFKDFAWDIIVRNNVQYFVYTFRENAAAAHPELANISGYIK